jgi:integrase/recombinase XerD
VFDDLGRDIAAIELPRWGRVVVVDGPVPWLGGRRRRGGGGADPPVLDRLRGRRHEPGVGVEWDKATPAENRDLVLWMRQAPKPRRLLLVSPTSRTS